jgi:hypothetical protein
MQLRITLIQVDGHSIILCRLEQTAELCKYHGAIVIALEVPRCQLHRLVQIPQRIFEVILR